MRIAIGADHAGYDLKHCIAEFLRTLKHEVVDVGTDDATTPVDYPDYAEAVGLALLEQMADRGLVICGSGVGAPIAINKLPGHRARLWHLYHSTHPGAE